MAARFDLQPRVYKDLEKLAAFVASWPRGNPVRRLKDVHATILAIVEAPELRPIRWHVPFTGRPLRRWDVGRFAIVYYYGEPTAADPEGVVSIRAVRHVRSGNVFKGVRERAREPYAPAVA